MSFLTKIFVVLVAVLALILVALVVPFVARTDDYQRQVKDVQDRVNVSDASARNAIENLRLSQDAVGRANASLLAAQQNSDKQIADLQQQVADANTARIKAEGEASTVKTDLTRLASAVKQAVELQDLLQKELRDRRDELVKEQTARVNFAAANDRLASDLEAAKRQISRDQENQQVSDDQITKLQNIVNRIPQDVRDTINHSDTGGTPYDAPFPIKGQVTKIEKFGDSTLVEINVGKTDNVGKNMRFLIHRGNQYLGTLVVSNVDTKASVGSLQLSTPGQTINKGDAVLSGTE